MQGKPVVVSSYSPPKLLLWTWSICRSLRGVHVTRTQNKWAKRYNVIGFHINDFYMKIATIMVVQKVDWIRLENVQNIFSFFTWWCWTMVGGFMHFMCTSETNWYTRIIWDQTFFYALVCGSVWARSLDSETTIIHTNTHKCVFTPQMLIKVLTVWVCDGLIYNARNEFSKHTSWSTKLCWKICVMNNKLLWTNKRKKVVSGILL